MFYIVKNNTVVLFYPEMEWINELNWMLQIVINFANVVQYGGGGGGGGEIIYICTGYFSHPID